VHRCIIARTFFAGSPFEHEKETVMSTKTNSSDEQISHGRRDIMRAAGAATLTGVASSLLTSASTAAAQQISKDLDNGPLGARLQGAQHFGLTVQNMDRAFEFYTEVLGGNEVMRDGDFHGTPIHNTLMTDQEIIARALKVDPRTIGVPDLKGGAQRLDVRFVQFDNFVIELLQYREADQPMGTGDSWAEPRDHMSPAYPRSMHICFYIRDDVNFAKFISDLEAECTRRGMSQVKANRVVTVDTEEQRKAAPASANANRITQGKSNGWSLIYCKGPEGEQLEFVQALDPVKQTFQQALESRRRTQSAG
jgi:catechol 2,3-dioxygenase-like lactoylglutathione lyase family enzyme